MGKQDPLLDDAAMQRIARFIASGEDPNAYFVSSERIRVVVREVKGVSEKTKQEVLESLEEHVICGEELTSPFHLGIQLAQMFDDFADQKGLTLIIKDLNDLNKLPLVARVIKQNLN